MATKTKRCAAWVARRMYGDPGRCEQTWGLRKRGAKMLCRFHFSRPAASLPAGRAQ